MTFKQIFISPQVKRGVIISNKLVHSSSITSCRRINNLNGAPQGPRQPLASGQLIPKSVTPQPDRQTFATLIHQYPKKKGQSGNNTRAGNRA